MNTLRLAMFSFLFMIFCLGAVPQAVATPVIGNQNETIIADRGHHRHGGRHHRHGWGHHRGWGGWGGTTFYRSYPTYYYYPGYNSYYYYDPYYYNTGSGLYLRFRL